MGEDVHRHFGRESLEIIEMERHVRCSRELVRQLAMKHREWPARTGDPHGVERAESVRESHDEIVGKLAPEGIVPAELTSACNLVRLERVEILAHSLDRFHGERDIGGKMIGHAGAYAARANLINELPDRERAIRHRSVRMAVDRGPAGHGLPGWNGSKCVRAVSGAGEAGLGTGAACGRTVFTSIG